MQMKAIIQAMALSGFIMVSATTASALYNNVFVIAEPNLADTWLAEVLPVSSDSTKQEQIIQAPAQQTTNVEPVTGDVHFSPNPGATFQYSGDEFSRYREVFQSDY